MLDVTDGFKKSTLDAEIEARIERHCYAHTISPQTAVKHFPVLARRQLLKRFLAHVDLFKMTLDVPGDIAEFGVYRGLGLFTWANLLEAYCIGDRTKVVWGFDNWRGFTARSRHDTAAVGAFDSGQFRQEVLDAIAIFDADRFIPQKPRIKLVDGQIEQTVPQFLIDHPGIRFSLLHLDCDLYLPTKAVLEMLWDRVVSGGIVIFDEYGIPEWPGETMAVDEWLANKPGLQLETLRWTNTPGAFLCKP